MSSARSLAICPPWLHRIVYFPDRAHGVAGGWLLLSIGHGGRLDFAGAPWVHYYNCRDFGILVLA